MKKSIIGNLLFFAMIFIFSGSAKMYAQDLPKWDQTKAGREAHYKITLEHIRAMQDEYKPEHELNKKTLSMHAAGIREATQKIRNTTSELRNHLSDHERKSGRPLQKIVYSYDKMLVDEMKIETELKNNNPDVGKLRKITLRLKTELDKIDLLWKDVESKIVYDNHTRYENNR